MNKLIYLYLAIGCLFCAPVFAQNNLVRNGSFTKTQIVNPDYGLINKAKYWFNPSKGTPDLTKKYGNNMAGIYLCSVNDNNREYIATRLVKVTDTCNTYHFKATLQLTDESKYGVNTIGIGFTKDTVLQQNRFLIKPDFVVNVKNNELNSTSSSDIFIDTVFKVDGIYKYLIIGNFVEDANADKTTFKPIKNVPAIPYGYYLVDDVELYETGNTCEVVDTKHVINNLLTINKTVLLDKVLFETNQYDILPISFPYLDSLAKGILSLNIKYVIISGHTDSIGSEINNQKLSLNRAEAVKQYLVSKNISTDKIKTEGKGSSKPLVPNNTSENRSLNRRVEMVLEN